MPADDDARRCVSCLHFSINPNLKFKGVCFYERKGEGRHRTYNEVGTRDRVGWHPWCPYEWEDR